MESGHDRGQIEPGQPGPAGAPGWAPQAGPVGAVGPRGPTPGPSPGGWTVCPGCGTPWVLGANSCPVCRQVDALPVGIRLTSPARRLAGYLLDGLLAVVTLFIGWIIWLLIVMKDGQTPAKQLLGTRAVRLDTHWTAGWGTTALREVIRIVIAYILSYTLLGLILFFWLLWDKDNRELWDLAAGTVVVNDPHKVLLRA
jgi:uncharacterized RDD family membrane protein YckC